MARVLWANTVHTPAKHAHLCAHGLQHHLQQPVHQVPLPSIPQMLTHTFSLTHTHLGAHGLQLLLQQPVHQLRRDHLALRGARAVPHPLPQLGPGGCREGGGRE